MNKEILGRVNREDLLKELKKRLKESRFRHVLGVEKMALDLCRRYYAEEIKCRTAALFHDYAKYYNLQECHNILNRYGYTMDEMEIHSVNLLHSKVAAFIAKYEYDVHDEEVFSAIQWHTTGHRDMSLTEKIIFVADAIEENRIYDNVEHLRKKAFESLDGVLQEILDGQIIYLIRREEMIHPDTLQARNFLLNHRGMP